MGRKQRIIVGTTMYESKQEVKSRCKEIFGKYLLGQVLDSPDDLFVRDLVKLHEEAEEKVGVGVDYFTVDREWQYKGRCVFIHRIDGSKTDVSLYSCVDPKTKRGEVRRACRHAIEDQIRSFKMCEVTEGRICPYKNLALTLDNSHVDHEAPATFLVLLDQWMAERALTYECIEVSAGRDMQVTVEMTNAEQRDWWRDFHRSQARLRLLSKRANLSDAKLNR